MSEERFFTNREIFDRFTDKIDELSKDLAETQRALKRYNGLRQKVEATIVRVDDITVRLFDVCGDVETIVAEGAGKNKLANGIGWAVGIIGALLGIAGGLLALASR